MSLQADRASMLSLRKHQQPARDPFCLSTARARINFQQGHGKQTEYSSPTVLRCLKRPEGWRGSRFEAGT